MELQAHWLLHGVAVAILLVLGVPIVILAAHTRRPRLPKVTPRRVGERRGRPSLHAALGLLAFGAAALVLRSVTTTTDAIAAAALSTAVALLATASLHALRRASFGGVLTVPLAGLICIGLLVAFAGPQRPLEHGGAHASTDAEHRGHD